MSKESLKFAESRALGIITWLTAQAYQHEAIEEQVVKAKTDIQSIFDLIASIKGDIRKRQKRERINH